MEDFSFVIYCSCCQVKLEPEEDVPSPSHTAAAERLAPPRTVAPASPPEEEGGGEELAGIRAVSRLLAATGYGLGGSVKPELDGHLLAALPKLELPPTPAYNVGGLHSAPRRRRRRNSGNPGDSFLRIYYALGAAL